MLSARFVLDPIETLYLASLLGDQPRSIDRFIDYFGDGVGGFEPEARIQRPVFGTRRSRASRGER